MLQDSDLKELFYDVRVSSAQENRKSYSVKPALGSVDGRPSALKS